MYVLRYPVEKCIAFQRPNLIVYSVRVHLHDLHLRAVAFARQIDQGDSEGGTADIQRQVFALLFACR